MKKHQQLAVLLIILILAGCGSHKDPSPLNNATQLWNFANNEGLKTIGDVTTGYKLSDQDRESALSRGGDGYAAQFNGGWLDAGQSNNNALNFGGYEFTLHVRFRIPDGVWNKPIISKHGGEDKLAWNLYGYTLGTGDKDWESVRQNYIHYGDSAKPRYALEFEMGVQPDPGFMKYKNMTSPRKFIVGVPVAMIGATQWHDVTVRFSGAKLEMFVDGVLVDEEWPIGQLRVNETPCLIGAAQMGDQLASGFKGEIATAAIWKRSISDEEIILLNGGKESVAAAELKILGSQKTSMQYWRPRWHNAWVGDVMPLYNEKDGRFHLFYLFDRRHHGSKWGCGAHQTAHASTTDLKNWQQHPLALSLTRQWETFGTGCPLIVGNHFELHYGMHTTRMFPDSVTTEPKMRKQEKETGSYSPVAFKNPNEEWLQKELPIGHSVAVSNDGIHFQKTDSILTPAQNMGIYQEPSSGMYRMIWDGWLLTSKDLRHWKRSDKILPTGMQTPANNSGECPNFFDWNGWHYVLMGRSGFWMARNASGPFWEGEKGENKNIVTNPSWDIYDGLMVPMVSKFKDNRRILMGFTYCPTPGADWGGYLVFRELIQYKDGTLGLKWPEEMIPDTEKSIMWKFTTISEKNNKIGTHEVSLKSTGFTTAEIADLPQSYRLTATIVTGTKANSFGLMFKGGKNYQGGCELQFMPEKKHAQWGTPQSGNQAVYIPYMKDANSTNAPYKGCNFSLENVEGLSKPFTIDVIVKYDPTSGITLADACIDGRRTMITNRYKLKGNSLYFFINGGEVKFKDITIRPLRN